MSMRDCPQNHPLPERVKAARRVAEIRARIEAGLRHRAQNGSASDIKLQISQAEARAVLPCLERAP